LIDVSFALAGALTGRWIQIALALVLIAAGVKVLA
jgi:hypothetical protein